jgi:tripartite-type tricarboxylate transporter receptor subunit TctC
MPFVLTVAADKNISSLSELIARAKADPGKINYGSAGIGGANHVVTEFFKRTAGIEMTHIPYRGMGEAMAALLGGQVDVLISTIAVAGAYLKSGRVVGLVVPSKEPQRKRACLVLLSRTGSVCLHQRVRR